jgi:hypothetical protein
MYPFTNVAKPQNNSAGASAPKEPNVTIIPVSYIQSWPARDSGKVNHVGSFVLKTGKIPFTVYMTPSKIKASFTSEGDEDAITFKQTFEGEHPGNELEIAEFVQNFTSTPCIIIYGSCADAFQKVIGTKCAPVQLKPELMDDNDKRHHTLKFEQFAKSPYVPGHYTGSVPTAVYTPVASATAINIAPANADGVVFKLPSQSTTSAIAFASITYPSGTIVTLIGGGGTAPATLSTGITDKKAILKDGSSWIGLDGAVINLEVFNDGTNTYLVEKSRA